MPGAAGTGPWQRTELAYQLDRMEKSACGAGGDRRALLTVDATQLDRAETLGRSRDITPAAPNYFRRAQERNPRVRLRARARGKTGFLRSAEVSWDAWEISCRERSCYVPGPGRFRGAPG